MTEWLYIKLNLYFLAMLQYHTKDKYEHLIRLHKITHKQLFKSSTAQPTSILLTLNVTSTLLLGYMLSHLESSIHRITAKTIYNSIVFDISFAINGYFNGFGPCVFLAKTQRKTQQTPTVSDLISHLLFTKISALKIIESYCSKKAQAS